MILQYYSYVPDAGILVMMQQQYFEFATMIFFEKELFFEKILFRKMDRTETKRSTQ